MRHSFAVLAVSVLALTACVQETKPVAEVAPPPPPAAPEPILTARAAATSAPDRCLTQAELEAEQAMILHTELMVYLYQCKSTFDSPEMNDVYRTFTVGLQGELTKSQRTLENFMARHGSGNKQRLFDSYRTELANNESSLARELGASRYCTIKRDKYLAAAHFTPERLAEYAQETALRQKKNYNMCEMVAEN